MAHASSPSVIEIQDTKHFEAIVGKYKKVVVDFGGSWCVPCKKIAPFFKQQADANKSPDTVFVSVDVDLCEVG
jgi:thiol-disulfide isomerase/thioredoxin